MLVAGHESETAAGNIAVLVQINKRDAFPRAMAFLCNMGGMFEMQNARTGDDDRPGRNQRVE